MGDPLIGNGTTIYLEPQVPVHRTLYPSFYASCPKCFARIEAKTIAQLRSLFLVHSNNHSPGQHVTISNRKPDLIKKEKP